MAVESGDHGHARSVRTRDEMRGTEQGHNSWAGVSLMQAHEERYFMSREQRDTPQPELRRTTRPEIQAIADAEIARLFGKAG